MDCTKPYLLALAGLLALLAALGLTLSFSYAASPESPAQQRFRYVAWDCSDWSMTLDYEDRGRAILEMLALNRGMTLYCGAEQSHVLTKAELWEAGQAHNERDDTVYWGDGGSFRGFTAPQEGWLTEGESGITGISIHRIFEFPREEKRRRRSRRSGSSAAAQEPVEYVNAQDWSALTAGPVLVVPINDLPEDRWVFRRTTVEDNISGGDFAHEQAPSWMRELGRKLDQVSGSDEESAEREVHSIAEPYVRQLARARCSLNYPGSNLHEVRYAPDTQSAVRQDDDGDWVFDAPAYDAHFYGVCRILEE